MLQERLQETVRGPSPSAMGILSNIHVVGSSVFKNCKSFTHLGRERGPKTKIQNWYGTFFVICSLSTAEFVFLCRKNTLKGL